MLQRHDIEACSFQLFGNESSCAQLLGIKSHFAQLARIETNLPQLIGSVNARIYRFSGSEVRLAQLLRQARTPAVVGAEARLPQVPRRVPRAAHLARSEATSRQLGGAETCAAHFTGVDAGLS